MFATIAYFVAVTYGAEVTSFALIATVVVDLGVMKTASDWVEARAMAKSEFIPVDTDELEEGEDALSADELEERYGGEQ